MNRGGRGSTVDGRRPLRQGQAEITTVVITIITTFDYDCNYNNYANYGAHVVCFSMFVNGHG